jgi:hypothetical protein
MYRPPIRGGYDAIGAALGGAAAGVGAAYGQAITQRSLREEEERRRREQQAREDQRYEHSLRMAGFEDEPVEAPTWDDIRGGPAPIPVAEPEPSGGLRHDAIAAAAAPPQPVQPAPVPAAETAPRRLVPSIEVGGRRMVLNPRGGVQYLQGQAQQEDALAAAEAERARRIGIIQRAAPNMPPERAAQIEAGISDADLLTLEEAEKRQLRVAEELAKIQARYRPTPYGALNAGENRRLQSLEGIAGLADMQSRSRPSRDPQERVLWVVEEIQKQAAAEGIKVSRPEAMRLAMRAHQGGEQSLNRGRVRTKEERIREEGRGAADLIAIHGDPARLLYLLTVQSDWPAEEADEFIEHLLRLKRMGQLPAPSSPAAAAPATRTRPTWGQLPPLTPAVPPVRGQTIDIPSPMRER